MVLSNGICTEWYIAHFSRGEMCKQKVKKHPPFGRMFFQNVYYKEHPPRRGDVLYSIHGEGAFL